MTRRFKGTVLVGLLLLVSLPYVLGYALAGTEWVFGGFLLNPIDGQSYLAKMFQGWQGAWRFTLPYTHEPGQGAYIFLNYLALGHLARLVGLPLALVYHLARLVGAAVLASGVMALYEETLPGAAHKTAVVLGLFGAGLGWLVVFFGLLPADVWVAEMYPFLSAYTNPHFPLGLGLLLWMLVLVVRAARAETGSILARGLLLSGLGVLLAGVQPFGIVVLAVVLGGWLAWEWAAVRRLPWQGISVAAAALGPGGAYLLYQYTAILADPVLAGWNAQNFTPAPPAWDFVLSLSPALLLAGVAAWHAWRSKMATRGVRLLLVWALGGLVLAYLPFPLQRRFLLGYFVPLAGLAAVGLTALQQRWPGRARALGRLALGLALPTNAIVLLIGLFGILSHAPEYYLTRDEAAVLGWLNAQSAPGGVVLASPEMGLYVPGHSGRRVIYGHPFETVNAASEEQAVLAVYSGAVRGPNLERFLGERGVDWILYGARERALGGAPAFLDYPVVFQSGADRVYAVHELP